jgi:hypothetical protein
MRLTKERGKHVSYCGTELIYYRTTNTELTRNKLEIKLVDKGAKIHRKASASPRASRWNPVFMGTQYRLPREQHVARKLTLEGKAENTVSEKTRPRNLGSPI